MVLKKIKKIFSGGRDDSLGEEYLEIDLGHEEKNPKVQVKLFVLNQYEDSTEVINSLREGYSIAVIDIKNLRKKDPIELKRAVSKIKKTADALEGSIAGFGENLVIVTPSFAKIQKENSKFKEDAPSKFETY